MADGTDKIIFDGIQLRDVKLPIRVPRLHMQQFRKFQQQHWDDVGTDKILFSGIQLQEVKLPIHNVTSEISIGSVKTALNILFNENDYRIGTQIDSYKTLLLSY